MAECQSELLVVVEASPHVLFDLAAERCQIVAQQPEVVTLRLGDLFWRSGSLVECCMFDSVVILFYGSVLHDESSFTWPTPSV